MIFRTRRLQQSNRSSSLRLRGTAGGGRYTLRPKCRFGRAMLYVACVGFKLPGTCFVSCYNLPTYHTTEERRTTTISGETWFQSSYTAGAVRRVQTGVAVHIRTRIQQQLAALRRLLSFITVSVMCVLFVCVHRVHRSVHIWYASVGGWVYAARFSSLDSSVERWACSKQIFRWMICLICQLRHPPHSIYLSRQGSELQQQRNSSKPCKYKYEYVSYVRTREWAALPHRRR